MLAGLGGRHGDSLLRSLRHCVICLVRACLEELLSHAVCDVGFGRCAGGQGALGKAGDGGSLGIGARR